MWVIDFCEEKSKKIDVNYVNDKGDTLVFTAIKEEAYVGEIAKLLNKVVKYGYNVDIINNDNDTLLDSMRNVQKWFTSEELNEVKKICNKETKEKAQEILLDEKEIEELQKYGNVLNVKKYKISPTIGRDREVKNLMVTLAQEKKNPIIVGESGVGKTAIVEELAYRISKGDVPKFLKNKIIYEIVPEELVAGCKYVGEFEEKLKKIFLFNLRQFTFFDKLQKSFFMLLYIFYFGILKINDT